MSRRITTIHYKKLIKIFQELGFKIDRFHGDHVVMNKKGAIRPIVFQAIKDVPIFQIENNLKIAKITKEEYIAVLKLI